ncbi:hypothetical protein D3C76_1125840 [compost metagenome]
MTCTVQDYVEVSTVIRIARFLLTTGKQHILTLMQIVSRLLPKRAVSLGSSCLCLMMAGLVIATQITPLWVIGLRINESFHMG